MFNGGSLRERERGVRKGKQKEREEGEEGEKREGGKERKGKTHPERFKVTSLASDKDSGGGNHRSREFKHRVLREG